MEQENERDGFNFSTLLSRWSKAIKEKASYKCEICDYDKDRRFLHSHHIIPQSIAPELALELSNGKCLCLLCHCRQHKSYVKFVFKKPKGVTQRELIAFLEWHKINGKEKSKNQSKISKYKSLTKKTKK